MLEKGILIVIGSWFFFYLFRAFSKLVFKPLTAHWFAIGITTSFMTGFLLVLLVHSFHPLQDSLVFKKPIQYNLALAWLATFIPLNLLVVPSLYWWDKRLAIKSPDAEVNRIPENSLHALAFCGGIFGAFIGQKLFHHKISKASFQIKHWVVCGFSILVYLALGYQFLINAE